MKHNIFYPAISAALLLSAATSCSLFQLDTYEGPDAALTGSIIDEATGENVQGDIVNGTTIKLIEHGYADPTPTYLVVKNDGTYRNSMLFEGKYTVQPDKRNFLPVDPQQIKISGETTLDFIVTPYIRFKEISIVKEANTVLATFYLEPTTLDAVEEVAIFASDQASVGSTVNSVSKIKTVATGVLPDRQFKIGINVKENSSYFKENRDYYFRVGARSSYSGALYNYAPTVKINIGSFTDDALRTGVFFDECESLTGWKSQGNLVLDTGDKTQGNASIAVTIPKSALLFYDRLLDIPVDTEVSLEDGVLAFDLYIENLEAFNWGAGDAQIEITSGGRADIGELHWTFHADEMNLRQGWNNVSLRLASAKKTGGAINLKAVNYFRLYHTKLNADATLKIDNIRFYEDY